jgi:hypothetical protein
MTAAAQEKKSESHSTGSRQVAHNKNAEHPQVVSDAGLSAAASVQAQLESTLDVKNAKVGDEVVLKTTQTIKRNGEVVVHKGSRLIGRVTAGTQRTKNSSESRLGLVFDRIEGKDLSAPITASIVSIMNIRAVASSADLFESDISGSSQSSGAVRSSGGSGGLLGGVGSTVGGVVNTATSTVGSVAGTATHTAGGAVGTVGRTVNGIQISNAVSGSANSSATLTAPGKSLRLEKGVLFNMNVAAQH